MSKIPPKFATADSFQNLLAGLGQGADNMASHSAYVFQYWTRNRVLLEALYRGSWVVAKAVNIVADDMTRAGCDFIWPGDDNIPASLDLKFRRLHLWSRINLGIRWARLFGGAIGVYMIDGQDSSTPLNLNTIGKGSFRGLHIIDRWTCTPSNSIIQEMGNNFGKPEYYTVASGQAVPFAGKQIHASRVIRFEGLELPYYQKLGEMGWGMSIVEPLYDRLVGFDTATAGAANLIHKAHLRVLKIEGLRNLIGQGGPMFQALLKNIATIRQLQTSEGITLIDGKDEMAFNTYTFTGMAEMIETFAQQVAGSVDVPLTRFFSASPSGLGSNGQSEERSYYDRINQDQENDIRDSVHDLACAVALSGGYGSPPPEFDIRFRPLWQLSDTEKSDIATKTTNSVLAARTESLITDQQALRELKQMSRVTGLWTTITEEDVNAVDDQLPDPMEMMQQEATIKATATGANKEPDSDSEQPTE